ncbi:hypothetical protein G7Y89_g9434 [Cudoniella acicularis]|uniref:Isopenicillin N synthase-like Fe(2+) 2OG dioxygenase domain-containing protein n=1 Tax=Cudoniella acicularis TaxID=354080 RepID=A0A8H4RHG4_9HELO|nr:hypothetical protein G7Y89_g9434 [Cudoniella acicularis]
MLKTDGDKVDSTELYNLFQDDVFELGKESTNRNLEPIENIHKECQSFFLHAHKEITEILTHLNKYLGLTPGTLASLYPLDKPSATSVRMLCAHPYPQTSIDDNITFPGHANISFITALFNIAGGLQILPAGCENVNSNWLYVQPQPGCAIINIADALVQLTGGVLRSSLHRVVTPPGKQASVE